MCLLIMYFTKVYFSATEIPVFHITTDVVSIGKISHSWFVVAIVSRGPTA